MMTVSPGRVLCYDAGVTFRKGAYVLSVEGGGGGQHDVERHPDATGLEFLNGDVRVVVPFGATGRGPVYGALEIGLEPFAQGYIDPVRAYFAGLAAVGRYHFLSLGRFVPYLELAGAAGGTTLRVREIDSAFTFLLFGGVGASYFLTDRPYRTLCRVSPPACFERQHVPPQPWVRVPYRCGRSLLLFPVRTGIGCPHNDPARGAGPAQET